MEKFYSKQIQLKIDFDCECIFLRFDPAQILLPKSELDSPAKFYGCTFNSTQTTFPQPPIRFNL